MKPNRKMKLHPLGQLTDTQVRMEIKNERLRAKWNADLTEEKLISKRLTVAKLSR